MSQQAIETILGKAVMEDEFRSTLFSDADSALAGYDLTAAESAALKGMDVEALENFAGVLDQRISKSIPIGMWMEDGLWVELGYHPQAGLSGRTEGQYAAPARGLLS